MSSWYKSFAELNAVEKKGQAFRVFVRNRRTSIAVIAPHGGGIEPGTSEIARAVAGRSLSIYTFDGLRSSGNELLHITSTLFDEPRCLNLVQKTNTVVAIHGCAGTERKILVGGLNIDLSDQIISGLEKAGFRAVKATRQFLGNQPENICNRGLSGQGVQLEIADSLRRSLFRSLDREGRKMPTPVFQKLVNALRAAIKSDGTLSSHSWSWIWD